MDIWKYYRITHRDHVLCNPLSLEKTGRLIDLLDLDVGSRVLDIATGKGEFLLQLAARCGISGVGIDICGEWIEEAKRNAASRGTRVNVTFLEMDGAAYRPAEGERFQMASCIGASWIYDGYEGTLRALSAFVEPGGLVVSGEPFWHDPPPVEYIEATGEDFCACGRHHENVATGERLGLHPILALASSRDEWDTYHNFQWRAAERYAREHPDDPDLPELLDRLGRERTNYLTWERRLLGWAVYVFRTPG